jgi:hypothetical protein
LGRCIVEISRFDWLIPGIGKCCRKFAITVRA